FLNILANLLPALIMSVIRGLLSLDILPTKLFVRLGSTEKVGCQLGAAHMIQNLLTLLQPLPGMNLLGTKATIQSLIALILENGIISGVLHTGHLSGLCQGLIMSNHFVADRQTLLILRKLFVVIYKFLLRGSDCKVGLTNRDNLFKLIAVHDNQITGVSGKHDIGDPAFCTGADVNHFAGIGKMVLNCKTAVFTGKFGAIHHFCETPPLRI